MTDAHRLYERLGFVGHPSGTGSPCRIQLIAFRLDLEESPR